MSREVPKQLDEDRSWVGGYVEFECGAQDWGGWLDRQTDRCRIAELEQRLAAAERERDVLDEYIRRGFAEVLPGRYLRTTIIDGRLKWRVDGDPNIHKTRLDAIRAALEADHA